jgi:hypothetical protein
VFPTVKFTLPVFLVSSFHGTLELRKQLMAELLREWIGGPFIELHVLLQIATTVQSFTSVI